MNLIQRSVGILTCCLCAHGAVAETVSFELIPNAGGANDITPNGRYIVGTKLDDDRPYRFDTWTNTMLTLPFPGLDAVAVSDDGKVIVGDMPDPVTGAEVAGIWTEQSGAWQSLGYLPNANQCPSLSNAYDVSADGSVVVGLSWSGCNGRGFRWTQATGMVELQVMGNGNNRASAVSGDGLIMAGFAQGSFSRTPTVWEWDGSAGVGQLLDPPNGDAVGEIYGMNHAGDIMFGTWNGLASRWTYPGLAQTTIGAGSLLPGWTGTPMGIAEGGHGTVVGFDILMGNRRAWIQPNGSGQLIELRSYIEGFGGVVPVGLPLQVARAISDDGRTIVGHGFNTGAWIVRITPSCPGDLDGSGVIGFDDLLSLLSDWGPCTSCAADLNGDGAVDFTDMLQLLGAWGACPGAVGACCIDTTCIQVTEADCLSAGGTYQGNSVPCTSITCEFNDLCADAIDITANINGDAIDGDNTTATPVFGGDPELPAGSPSCQWNENPGGAHSTVWYTFTAPANGSVTIATCASSAPFNDSMIALYAGGCGALTEVQCADAECDDPAFLSRLTATGLTPGNVYRIAVMNSGDWGGSQPGPFVLTIESP